MIKNKKPNAESSFLGFAKNAFGITTIIAIAIVAIATWLQIQAITHPQPGMEFIFIVYAPYVYAACAFLFLRGIVLLVRAVRRHDASRRYRIALAVVALVFLFPGSYLVYGFVSYQFVKFNAQHMSTNKEVLQLIQECKAATVRREYVSWDKPADQRQSKAALYLKDSAKSAAEKSSYFYGYRSFDPEYYDELAAAALSDEVQHKCGNVELYDEHREAIPITYSWATKEEALETIQACKIRNIVSVNGPTESELVQAATAKSAKASIFIVMDPIAEGFAGTLYIKDADQNTRSTILDFAKTKKGFCRYKQPNIDGVE